MQLLTNPYIAGNPVGDSPAFIGREDVLREVRRVLRQPQSNAIVLYGQRRIGKTSILQHLESRLPAEGPYRTVYFDLQDKAEWSLNRVLSDLAAAISIALNQSEPHLGNNAATDFRKTWLPGMLDDLPDDCSLVLLFDEFDVLSDPQGEQAARAFFPYLRELLADDPARLQFVFVIGRNVGDLSAIALSLFKSTPYYRVSLLNGNDTTRLARLSEENGTLNWPNEAIVAVWDLTHGHPFLTQQLCSHVWEILYDDNPDTKPTVTPDDIKDAIPDALQASENALEWLWNGLGPAERVVAAALAEVGPKPISREALDRILYESGVRVLIRELQNAPQLLQEWDIVESSDEVYRFRVELLRGWIAERKPLKRVQEELDRIQPVAENLYRAAWELYKDGQANPAISLLRRATSLNPNHVGANQLLADILVTEGQSREAQELLERLYDYHPTAARAQLLKLLLSQVQEDLDDDGRLEIYEKVLCISPTNIEATRAKRRIWQQRGDEAYAANQLETALIAYQKAGLTEKETEIEDAILHQDLKTGIAEVECLEQEGRYSEALQVVKQLSERFPDQDWDKENNRLERKTSLDSLYQRAIAALENKDNATAQELFIQVIELDPDYKDVTRYLHSAVTGTDIQHKRTFAKGFLSIAILASAVAFSIGILIGFVIGLQVDRAVEKRATTWVRPLDGMTMIEVPPGTYPMSNTFDQNTESEIYTITLGTFWIDRTEITNSQFRRCVEAGHCDPPLACDWGTSSYNNLYKAEHPVVCVDWEQAVDYCTWIGGRLPNEIEWKYVAQGPQGNSYPWGNKFDGTALNICDKNCENEWAETALNDGYAQTAPVGSFPKGASWVGALDMVGNVWEWVADWEEPIPSEQAATSTGADDEAYKVLMGGSWAHDRSFAQVTSSLTITSTIKNYDIGFRCVLMGIEP